jgi:hypothetical protein
MSDSEPMLFIGNVRSTRRDELVACPKCGAAVWDDLVSKHLAWHEAIDGKFINHKN